MTLQRWTFLDTMWKRQAKVDVANASERASSDSLNDEAHAADGLDRRLHSPQIFMIALSGIIGITIFATMGQFIHTAGPAGLLTAILFVGVTAICVMEGLGELAVQWPVSNAMVQYVRTFIDDELAIAIGLVYWYTWSSVISAMVVAAANLSQYWNFSATGCIIVFYIVCPVSIIVVNWIGVFWYGIVECIGGLLKFLFVLMGAFFMIAEGTMRYGSQYINQGYQDDTNIATGRFSAVLLIIPFLTYGFLGVEIVSVTGFEAKYPRTDLKLSARWIAYVITTLFLLCAVGETLNVPWDSPQLSPLQTRTIGNVFESPLVVDNKRNFSVLVLAANNAGFHRLAGFFNGCLITSCLSAANTALYVASRVLYGLVNESKTPTWLSWMGKLNRFRVPMWALVVSVASWCWLPFLQSKKGYSTASFFSVIITIGSVGTVIVWASQCLAFIRYYHWMRAHKDEIRAFRQQEPRRWKKYDRWLNKNSSRYYSILSELQPLPAYVGLFFSCLIVLVFSSATLWTGPVSAKKFFVAYGGLLLCVLICLLAKVINRNYTFWKPLGYDVETLRRIVGEFEERLFLRDPDEEVTMQHRHSNNVHLLESGIAGATSEVVSHGNNHPLMQQVDLESTGAHLNAEIRNNSNVSGLSMERCPPQFR